MEILENPGIEGWVETFDLANKMNSKDIKSFLSKLNTDERTLARNAGMVILEERGFCESLGINYGNPTLNDGLKADLVGYWLELYNIDAIK